MAARRIDRRNVITKHSDVKKDTLKGVSDYRRAEIQNVKIKEFDKIIDDAIPTGSIVHGNNFRKNSSVGSPPLPGSKANSDMMGPDVYSPLYQLANMNLPRDRVTMNAWNRIFYDTMPMVRNCINLHSSYPISKINISSKSKKVQQFFSEMAEKIDLYSLVYGVALEYWKNGEVFCYGELDRDHGTWKRMTVLNPDYVTVKKSPIGDDVFISLRPDASLQRIIASNHPEDMKIKKKIPQHVLDCVRKGYNIPLNNLNVSHLKLLSSPYDIRGTSIIVSIYKDLMLYDQLRESKFAQAANMINPRTLVKLGGEDYKPTQADIEAFRQIFEEAQYDKDYTLVTHNGVTVEKIGNSGAIVDIASDIELIMNNIYAGLMVPKSLIEHESVSYASSSIGLEVLRQRYDMFRNMLKKWLELKVFAPICELQDFFEYVDGEKRLEVPTVDFNNMNLYDMNDYITNIATFVGNKQVSVQTLYRTLGLSYEEEGRRLKEEAINFAIRTKEEQILAGMRLSELLTLDPDKSITEPAEDTAVPQAPEEAMGLPGMDMPGMGGPPAGGPASTPPGDAPGASAPPMGIAKPTE